MTASASARVAPAVLAPGRAWGSYHCYHDVTLSGAGRAQRAANDRPSSPLELELRCPPCLGSLDLPTIGKPIFTSMKACPCVEVRCSYATHQFEARRGLGSRARM